MKTQLIIKDKIILHNNLNPKLMITSCEFKDINLDNIEESVFSSQLRNLQDSDSYEDDSEGVEFVHQEEYEQQGYDEDEDCICFEYEQEEDAMERPEAIKVATSRATESDDEECSYESSSTDTDSDEINIEILLICNNNNNIVNANESMIEKAMELEDKKTTKSNIFPPEKMSFWFGNEEQEQIQEIFQVYTKNLHPQNHLKNYRRGAQSYVASIKREPLVPINKSNSFQTLDTILIFRKDLNIPNGVSFPITNILFSLTNWNIQEGIPTNVDIISCQQRFSDIKTLRVATNIKPSFLSCLPLSENLQNEHHYMVSNQFIDITRDTSYFKTNYHQKFFPFRNYEDGKGIFFDVREPMDQSNPLYRDL